MLFNFQLRLFVALFITLFSTLLMFDLEGKHFNYDFSLNAQDWEGDFADYPVGEENFFELKWGWAYLPVDLIIKGDKALKKGIFLSGNNHSDDLFMFIKHQIKGLKPNIHYELTFDVAIEDDIPPNQFGIGGSPGESVYFKVGASPVEPQKIDIAGFYRLNVEKGEQSQGGKNAIVAGNLANPLVDPNHPQFEPKFFTNLGTPLRVQTDCHGSLWLFIGTDSGFEGSTLYYIAKIDVNVKKCEIN